MKNYKDEIKYKNNVLVASLIKDVLNSKLSVALAYKKFPKDSEDPDFKCAFDALVYREADEEIRKKDPEYAQLQDDLLLEIAQTLENNQPLPKNVVSVYYKYNKDKLITDADWKMSFKNILSGIKRMINF